MGLFDKRDKHTSAAAKAKKGKDDFDSPVEKIDLSAPPVAPAAAQTAQPDPAPAAAAAAQAARPVRRAPEPMAPSYGIDKAIELMRTLPADNVELVVQVVKHTLESTQIRIAEIIQDAIKKQDDIQGRIQFLRGEITEFEKEIETRKEEISRLDADYKETSTVRERLELAENLGKKSAPAAAGRTAAPGASAQHAGKAATGKPETDNKSAVPVAAKK